MKEGVLQYCLSTAWGGLEMVALETALKLRSRGIRCVTVCRPGSPLQSKLREASLLTLGIRPGHKYFSPRLLALTRKLIRSGRFSTILIQQMSDLWHVAPALVGYEDIHLAAISHTFVGVLKKDLLHELLYGRLDVVIALTDLHRKNLLSHLPLRPEQISVVPNAVNSQKFCSARRSEAFRKQFLTSTDQVLIGIVSRLDRAKGLHEAVKAAHQLQLQKIAFQLVIVGKETAGEPGTQLALTTEIENLGLQKRVHLAGHRDDVEVAVASFDILLMPSPAETFGRVVIEAMASNVPVVAAAGGGVPGIIQHGINGLLFPPESIQDMAEQLKSLCQDPIQRRHIMENGLKSVHELYDSEVVTNQLHRLLRIKSKP